MPIKDWKIQGKVYKPKTFIKAMEETILEYQENRHVCTTIACKLCQTDEYGCRQCPWVVILGVRCTRANGYSPFNSRNGTPHKKLYAITRLRKFIALYEEYITSKKK